jgi:hypothetical protein
MDLHECPACGLQHGAGGAPPANPEVEIARINASRDVEVAKLAARQEKDWNETRIAETEVEAAAATETAAIEAESGVEAAEAVADALTPEPDPAVVIEAPDTGPAEEEPTIEPADGGNEPPPAPKKSSWSYW